MKILKISKDIVEDLIENECIPESMRDIAVVLVNVKINAWGDKTWQELQRYREMYNELITNRESEET